MFRFIWGSIWNLTGRFSLAEVKQELELEPLDSACREFLIYDGSN